MPREPSEHEIQRALVNWLNGQSATATRTGIPPALRPGVIFWHTPNGGARSAIEGKRFKEIGTKPGIPDLFFFADSRLYALEMKNQDGVVSDAQSAVMAELAAAGAARIAVAFTLAQAKQYLRDWGLAA